MRFFQVVPPIETVVLMSMWLLMASGAQEEKGPLLTSVFLNLLALPTDRLQFLPPTSLMRKTTRDNITIQRICEVKHGTFSSLVFSSTGGTAREATVIYKRLASFLSERWKQPYIVTMGWLRALFVSVYYDQPYSAFGEPDHSEVDQCFIFSWM